MSTAAWRYWPSGLVKTSKKPQSNEHRVILCHYKPQVIYQSREKNAHQMILWSPTLLVTGHQADVMFSMGWCRATNISICSGSQVTDRMTTWQGRGMCDGEINLFGTNLDKNHSLYRRLPRSCAIPRAFWTRVEAIRCNYPGRKHRKVRISSLIIERRIAFTLETGPGQGQRQNIAREYWNGGLKIKWTDLCVQRLFYFTVLLKLWVKGQGHKGEFLWCWLMGIRSCVCIV